MYILSMLLYIISFAHLCNHISHISQYVDILPDHADYQEISDKDILPVCQRTACEEAVNRTKH